MSTAPTIPVLGAQTPILRLHGWRCERLGRSRVLVFLQDPGLACSIHCSGCHIYDYERRKNWTSGGCLSEAHLSRSRRQICLEGVRTKVWEKARAACKRYRLSLRAEYMYYDKVFLKDMDFGDCAISHSSGVKNILAISPSCCLDEHLSG